MHPDVFKGAELVSVADQSLSAKPALIEQGLCTGESPHPSFLATIWMHLN
jgi:hypothetical protein